MSIFQKNGSDRALLRQDTTPSEAGLTVIGAGTRIIGDIESNGIVKIDGTLDGSIRGANQLFLGRSGVIHGDVHASEVVLGGTVAGEVVAGERAEVQGTCNIKGNIQTKSIVVLEGGVINGTVRMDGVHPQATVVQGASEGARTA